MLKIGLIQLAVKEGKTEENCNHIRELVKKYSADDIDLLCLPELSVSGYDFEAAKESKNEKDFYAQLACECHMSIMAGVNVFCDDSYYDAVCVWDETGKLLGEYRKIHLWDKEYDFFAPGDELVVVPFKEWKIGILICADLRFFEVSTPLKNMGADVIFYPSAWAYGWKELFHLCGKMRAAENQIYAITLNRATGDAKYCGGTAVMDPAGNILTEIEDDAEEYLRAELKKEIVGQVRETLAWESMKLPHVYEKYDNYRYGR